MKTKYLTLMIVTIAFGITSAAASGALVLRDAYIEIQLFQNGPWTCVDSGVDCDDTSTGAACNVTITTASGTKTVRGKLVNTNCGTAINHTTATAQTSPVFGAYNAR